MTEKEPEQVLQIVRLGHPVLRELAEEIPTTAFGTPGLRKYEQNMVRTMFQARGVGLAGPQVANSHRCFVYYVPGEEEGEMEVSPRLLINPVITPVSNEVVLGWEGCLSIPGLRGAVERYWSIKVDAFDVEGQSLSFVANDFHARVIQHEQDHLDGIVFLDRMESMDSLCFEEEWAYYHLQGHGDDEDVADEDSNEDMDEEQVD